MRVFAKLHPARRSATGRLASGWAVEMLESRTLLNATLSSAIAPLTFTPGGAGTTVDLNAHFVDPNVPGTAVRFTTGQGNIDLALFDQQTPKTVANFLAYVNSGEYTDTVIHRVVSNFIVQGGGYKPDQSHIATIGTGVQGEPGISNTTGTIAMALSSGPNSATSEWFINLTSNTFLDSASSGGPFTVFGKVAYNTMTTVNQIAALPRGMVPPTFVPNTAAGDSPSGALPLQNWSQGQAITPSNYVTLDTVSVVPNLTYSATSDNPSLVTANASGAGLVLTPGSGTGIANVTVTATDLGGNVATTTFQVGVGVTPSTPLNTVLGGAGAKQIRFVDADGTSTTIAINGPGSATLNLSGTVASQTLSKSKILTVTGTALNLALITATGTTSATTVTITGHGGNGVVELGALNDSGALRSLNAHNTDLAGNVTIGGGVGSVNILSGTSGTLASAGIGHMVVKGAFANDVSASSIAGFTAGSITGGTWNVTGNVANVTAGSISNWTANVGTLGKLTSKTTIASSVVRSAGNVGAVAASTITGSTIFAGVAALPGGQNLPAAAGDFAAPASISSVRSKTFSNSDIAAQTLGRLTLGSVTTANAGTAFGVAAHTIQALTASSAGKTLKLKNVAAQAEVTAALTASGFAPGDFLVRII